MSSMKKTSGIILATIIVAGIVFGVTEQFETDDVSILEYIEFDAVYLKDERLVKISFEDKSNNTESGILEILGMDVTYHQEYVFDRTSKFVERISLEEIPKYGWKTIPVTLEIQHAEFGKIGLKTEIHEPDQPNPKIIIEQK
jgi:hypothetical protein|tara:strand:+ start:3931 stop:4356 length:426 start_codon:yes stop_codon:yes gene_type:complete